jgi:DNA-binding Xre family transcriptional regulator
MSKRAPKGKTRAARGDAELSPRRREAVDELGKLRDVLAAGEPVADHFRVDVVAPDPAFSELLAALRLERERLGLTLGEISRRTGIDTGDLSRLENGKVHDPRSSTLMRHARALGKRPSWSSEEAE